MAVVRGREASSDVRPRGGRERRCELGGVDDEVEMEAEPEVEAGVRRPAKMSDPKEPSAEERTEHDMSHLPFRNWCRHCVRGRGKEAAHKRQEGPGEIPEVHFDFAFMGDENGAGNTVTMLVARVRADRMTLATAVPTKGTGEFVVNRVIAFLKEVGTEKGT